MQALEHFVWAAVMSASDISAKVAVRLNKPPIVPVANKTTKVSVSNATIAITITVNGKP